MVVGSSVTIVIIKNKDLKEKCSVCPITTPALFALIASWDTSCWLNKVIEAVPAVDTLGRWACEKPPWDTESEKEKKSLPVDKRLAKEDFLARSADGRWCCCCLRQSQAGTSWRLITAPKHVHLGWTSPLKAGRTHELFLSAVSWESLCFNVLLQHRRLMLQQPVWRWDVKGQSGRY